MTLPTAGHGAADLHRPAFHLTAPSGWLNDPNGLCEWDGVFHLFYQYNPQAPVHALIHWGHATSTDMIHWNDESIALAPSPGPDADGCWSGVLVNDHGTPTLVYSGHAPSQRPTQSCCVATGTPDLNTWTKSPNNPVIGGPPADIHVTEFRDHTVWRSHERWHQAIGSGLVGHGGALFHYSSPDLQQWELEGPLITAPSLPAGGPFSGTTWECPDLFTLPDPNGGTHDVIVFSAWDEGRTLYPLYLTGRLADDSFVPDTAPQHLDLGLRHFYAPQSFTTTDGRRIQYGWAQEARPEPEILAVGWSGVMSLPRQLSLRGDGQLTAAPAAEVEALRIGDGERLTVTEETAEACTSGDQLDLEASVTLPVGGSIEVALRATPDMSEATVLRLRRNADQTTRITLDRSHSRHFAEASGFDVTELGGELATPLDHPIELRIILDHSILEVFAAGVPLTARIYPDSAEATHVRITVLGGDASAAVTIWQMQAAGRTHEAAA